MAFFAPEVFDRALEMLVEPVRQQDYSAVYVVDTHTSWTWRYDAQGVVVVIERNGKWFASYGAVDEESPDPWLSDYWTLRRANDLPLYVFLQAMTLYRLRAGVAKNEAP